MISERQSQVLATLVEEYIRTGEPVSSSSILDRGRLGVSSATVRNDLAVLDREGYADQPHTSAGRVPTAAAYRYYVDHLGPARLRSTTKTRIHDFFTDVHTELSRLMKATTSLLSDVTHYPAVVLGPGLAGDATKAIHLVHLAPRSLLLVLVSELGQVSQQVLTLDEPATPDEVRMAEDTLGTLVEDGFDDDAVDALAPEVRTVVTRAWAASERAESGDRSLYVGGTSQLGSIWADIGSVNRVLEVLEREAMLLRILARANAGTLIQIGEEVPGGGDVALVTSSYGVTEGAGGAVGVIGPMRMDYKRTISVVEEVSEVLAGLLGAESDEVTEED
ncbi:MAG: heat-inducible transcription repressor HrcA [Acidimicrobiia bacterium]|nr:MAG: heat-inducible transcription repressor HrcA [Acidimicrobiia bacterium]